MFRKEIIFLLVSLILISCSRQKKEFDLKGKWVILSYTIEGKEVIDEISTDISSLSYYLYEKKTYPAIRFKDSVLVFPGKNDEQLKFLFSADKNLDSLEIKKLKGTTYASLSPFIQNSLLKTFRIEKDYEENELVLKSGNEAIKIINAEIFSLKIKRRFLD